MNTKMSTRTKFARLLAVNTSFGSGTGCWSSKAQALGGLELAHLSQEFTVGCRLSKSLNEKFHRFNRRQRIQDFAQYPNALQIILGNEQFFFTRPRALNINRRKSALIHQFAVENDFRIAGAFEFFEDHIVHARTSVDECRRNDSQRSALFDVSS